MFIQPGVRPGSLLVVTMVSESEMFSGGLVWSSLLSLNLLPR